MSKIKYNILEAEGNLEQFSQENPELSQALMLRGIGYALLAIFELLQEMDKKSGQATPASQHIENAKIIAGRGE